MVQLYPKELKGIGHHSAATVLYRNFHLHNLVFETHDKGSASQSARTVTGIQRSESVSRIL